MSLKSTNNINIYSTTINLNKSHINNYEIDLALSWLLRNVHTITTISDLRNKIVSSLLNKNKIYLKFGIDPTGGKLHIGHLIVLNKIKEFLHLLKHANVYLLIGNFTVLSHEVSRSNKSILSHDMIRNNTELIIEELHQIFKNFSGRYEIVKNEDWLNDLSLKTVLRINNQFQLKNLVDKFGTTDVSVSTVLYPCLQAYDSVHLKSDIEFGGIDQLVNLYFARQVCKIYNMIQVNVMTHLISDIKGGKMSKSTPQTCIFVSDKNFITKIIRLPDSIFLSVCFNLGLNHMINHDIPNFNLEKKRIAEYIFTQICMRNLENEQQYKVYMEVELIPGETLLDIIAKSLSQAKSNIKKLFRENKIYLDNHVITSPSSAIHRDCNIRIGNNTMIVVKTPRDTLNK